MSSNAVRAVAALDDAQRARLHAFVRAAAEPVTREEAAAAAGISRKLAAFHLDRLVEAGLLAATFDRAGGGESRIGRAPKRYRPTDVELSVTIPQRHYDFVAEILLDAAAGAREGEAAVEAVGRIAHERGRHLGERTRAERRLGRLGPERAIGVVTGALSALGFEPRVTADGIVQRNCPFHRLAQRSPELVCGINCRFVGGLLEGLDAPRLHAVLAPAEGRCCVIVTVDS